MNQSPRYRRALLSGALGLCLGAGCAAHAEIIYQTSTMGVGTSWLDADKWSNTNAPTAGNDYVNANDGGASYSQNWATRTPTGSTPYTFEGDSLTLTNGASLKTKGSGTYTFNNLTAWADDGDLPAEIQNAGGGAAIIAGNLHVKGTGTFRLNSDGNNRFITFDSLMTVDPGVDVIEVVMLQSPTAELGYSGSGFTFNNTDNTFSGLWDVQRGKLAGAGLGTASFKVGPYAYLDFDADYESAAGDLTIESGGVLQLDQALTFNTVTINFEQLSAKTWSVSDLQDEFGSTIVAGNGDGEITVLTGPDPVPTETVNQSADMPVGADWSQASYWADSTAPNIGYLYANNTAGWITRTPTTASTFGGYDLSLLNGSTLSIEGAASFTVDRLNLYDGATIQNTAEGAATLGGVVNLLGSGEVTFMATTTNSMTTVSSFLISSNGSISKITIDMDHTLVSNTVSAANSGFNFALENHFDGLWEVRAGMLKGSSFGTGSFLVTDFGRLDFDATYRNLSADLTVEGPAGTNTVEGGSVILDQNIQVGSATIWGETLAPGIYTGAELKAHAVYGGAWAGDRTSDSALLAVGVALPIYQTKDQPTGLGWTDTSSWDNGEAPSLDYDYASVGHVFRSPNVAGPVFGGRSITLSNGAQLKARHSGYATVTNLTMHASTQIRAVTGSGFDGDITMVGEGIITCNTEVDSRTLDIMSLVTAEEGISNIVVTCTDSGFAYGSAHKLTGFTFSNPDNTFSGTWVVNQAYLKGTGMGQGSFLIGQDGYLDLDADYVNTNADLTVMANTTNALAGGEIRFDQNMTVGTATIWGEQLEPGTYTVADLQDHPVYGGAFDEYSDSGATLTVTFDPPVPEIGDIAVVVEGANVIIGWEGSEIGTYTLQGKTDLPTDSMWSDLVPGIVGVDGPMSVTNPVSGSVQFYRVVGDK